MANGHHPDLIERYPLPRLSRFYSLAVKRQELEFKRLALAVYVGSRADDTKAIQNLGD